MSEPVKFNTRISMFIMSFINCSFVLKNHKQSVGCIMVSIMVGMVKLFDNIVIMGICFRDLLLKAF